VQSEREHILFALAQGWQIHLDNGEPEEKVLAELSGVGPVTEGLVRGGTRKRVPPSARPKRPLLEATAPVNAPFS
jgi:hypothetical protein